MQHICFDPTPKSIKWITNKDLPKQFNFFDFGIAEYDGITKFYPPEDPSHISHTMLFRESTSKNSIEVPVRCLKSICNNLEHKRIDILKMDIEGAEYAVIEDILGSDIEIKQILVEFHDRFDSSNGKPSRESIKKLLANGYDILSISESGNEYSFIKKEMIKEKIKTPLEINDIPVALITYNRPAHTKKVLNELSKHHIQNLYIFSDAPKNGNDVEKVNATRKLFKGIDWTQPNIIYQETNQGLAKSIISAVDLVFEKYSTVIVLEDDCVPQKYFFEFMKKSLDKYENAENIYGISGYSIPLDTDVIIDYPFDNYFFPRIGSWGWATWKHKWNQRIDNLDLLYEKLINNKINLEQGGTDVPQMLTALRNGTLKDVWTISWLLTVYLKMDIMFILQNLI